MSTEDRSDMPLHTQTLESLLAAQVTYIASLAPILAPELSLLLFESKIFTTDLFHTCLLAITFKPLPNLSTLQSKRSTTLDSGTSRTILKPPSI